MSGVCSKQEHPFKQADSKWICGDNKRAIEMSGKLTAEELDEIQERELNGFIQAAMELEKERKQWVANSPRVIRPLVSMIHAPLCPCKIETLQ